MHGGPDRDGLRADHAGLATPPLYATTLLIALDRRESPPCMHRKMASDRTTLRLNDKRKRKLDRAKRIVARDEHDDPPMADVFDAALEHLIESKENLEDAREEHPPDVVQDIANTSVLGLYYRTEIESRWR